MRRLFAIALAAILLVLSALDLVAFKIEDRQKKRRRRSAGDTRTFAREIIDYQKHLNPRFVKRRRKTTRFIIIHSTEGSLGSSLRTLSRGKVRRRRLVSRGGHAHYLIAKNGKVYRILNPKYWANHAGVSMWNGVRGLSHHSLGIELEGYHNVPFTDRQYRSLRKLLRILQKRFRIKDRDVLGHYRVAYSGPNRFNRKRRRGRKRDPGIDNFDRRKAGLKDEYSHDPDVMAGRISGDEGPVRVARKSRPKPVTPEAEGHEKQVDNGSSGKSGVDSERANVITASQTAWKIAGRQYKAASTLYRFPDGRSLRGHEIQDWSDIPSGTEVELGAEEAKVVNAERAEVLLPEVAENMSPWKIANALYNSSFTYYIYPSGKILGGHRIDRFQDVPVGTRVLIAYRRVPAPRTQSRLGEDLEDVFLSRRTLYLMPSGALKSGEQVEDFSRVPREAIVFTKVE